VVEKDRTLQHLSVAAAAKMLRIHPKLVERACRSGQITASRRPPGRVRRSKGKGQGRAWQIAPQDLINAVRDGFGRRGRASNTYVSRITASLTPLQLEPTKT